MCVQFSSTVFVLLINNSLGKAMQLSNPQVTSFKGNEQFTKKIPFKLDIAQIELKTFHFARNRIDDDRVKFQFQILRKPQQ